MKHFSFRLAFWVMLLGIFLAGCSQNRVLIADPKPQSGIPGLRADYFGRADFSGPRVNQIDRWVYFDWGEIAPAQGLLPDAFSVRWQATVQLEQTQRYTLLLTAKGSAKLYINNKAIASGSNFTFKANKRYNLRLDFVKTQAEAAIKLEWRDSEGSTEIIPQRVFIPKALERSELSSQSIPLGHNLLLNGDFEGGTGGWIRYGGSYSSVSPGRNGSGKAVEGSQWTWIQQDLPVSSISAHQPYTLRAYARALEGATCTVGLTGGSSTEILFSETFSFRSSAWLEQGTSFTVPEATVWMAVYLASSNERCQFDDLYLALGNSTDVPKLSTEVLRNADFEEDFSYWGHYGGTASISSYAASGTKSLRLENFAWVQQDLPGSLFKPNTRYVLSAYVKAAQGASCRLGFVAASPTRTLFSESLDFNENHYRLQFLQKDLPAELSWAAIYMASGAAACHFDALRLEESTTAGQFGPVINWPIIAIHTILTPQGSLLSYGTDAAGKQGSQFIYDVWNPEKAVAADAHNTLPNTTSTDIFCSAQIILPETGDILISGGDARPLGAKNKGINDVTIFDSITQNLSKSPLTMLKARWYPTATTLPSGQILLQGGTDFEGNNVTIPELYTPNQGWTLLTGAQSSSTYGLYPRAFVGLDGKVIVIARGSRRIWQIDPAAEGSIVQLGTLPAILPDNALPAALYEPGKILLLGRFGDAVTLDTTMGLSIVPTASPSQIRLWSNTTLLADGQVLLSGGSSKNNELFDVAYHNEIWNPKTGQWTVDARAKIPRLYHSTAILLPDATVLTAGGGAPGPLTNLNAELYYPPYLFSKDGSGRLAERPVIESVAGLDYNQAFSVNVHSNKQIARVTLVKTGSVTHSFDMESRFLELGFTQQGKQLSVAAPENALVAPPGYYMLFIFDAEGVPSKAAMLSLN